MDNHLLVAELIKGLVNFTAGNGLMIIVGSILIALAVIKQYEPVLLLPIGFGCILANIPLAGMTDGDGLFGVLYKVGISTEIFPLLIFVGVGAMIDFSPLLAQPKLVLLGAAGQFGIFGTLMLATFLGFPLNEAASIGVIGAIDGPTSIFVATKLAPRLLAPIAVAAYSYMSLVPIIQPPLMRLLITPAERRIRMEYAPRPVSHLARILFPILVTLIVGLLVPDATPLTGTTTVVGTLPSGKKLMLCWTVATLGAVELRLTVRPAHGAPAESLNSRFCVEPAAMVTFCCNHVTVAPTCTVCAAVG